jgi:chromosome segregation ATPase
MTCPDDKLYIRMIRLEEFKNEQPNTISNILRRLEKCEEYAKQIDEKDKKIEELNSKLKNIIISVNNVINNASENDKYINEVKFQQSLIHQDVSYLKRNSQEEIQKIKKSQEDYESSLENLRVISFSLQNRLIDTQKDHEPHIQFQKEAQEQLRKISGDIERNYKQIETAHINAQNANQKTEMLVWQSENVISEVQKIKENFPKDMRAMFLDLQNSIFSIRDNVKNRLDNLPEAIDADELKKEIFDQFTSNFEKYLLDLQNTALRSSNNDTQIKQIEKKIENLQLQIKQLQLKG